MELPDTFGQVPNVVGSLRSVYQVNAEVVYSGVFAVDSPGGIAVGTTSGPIRDCSATFYASRSSSIYGGSTKVQPKSVQFLIIIKA